MSGRLIIKYSIEIRKIIKPKNEKPARAHVFKKGLSSSRGYVFPIEPANLTARLRTKD
jgi:hypothetical protein